MTVRSRASSPSRVRYAVVGQGYFSQCAVLPAFPYADNSELVAIFSGDRSKLKQLQKQHGVRYALPYEEYDSFLAKGEVDAVYIALPNSLHCEYSERAAAAKVHVLCEKPMAVTEEECERMISAAQSASVKLMVAYRLHFESANLEAIRIATSGEIGEPRLFNSVFTMQVEAGNTRVRAELGGGPLYDLGIYCINAARNIFRSEPLSVFAFKGTPDEDERFDEIDEHFGALLRFPGDCIATFSTSFGACGASHYEILGTKGSLRVEPAYDFDRDLRHLLTTGDGLKRRTFKKRDQVAAELVYFSDCILHDREPEPSGREGLADVRVIAALLESARIGERVDLDPFYRRRRPDIQQEQHIPAHATPELIHADPPGR